jgi:hypothetical protein
MGAPSLHQDLTHADWPAQNFRIGQRSVQKRYGYKEDRDLGDGVEIQDIVYYKKSDGSTFTIYLTPKFIAKRESSGTWSFLNVEHTADTISSISVATVTGNGTDWVDATDLTAPEAGDFFIVDADWTAASEPDPNWGEIESITNDTTLVLVDAYTGATSSGAYTIRKTYSVPTNERWSWALLNDRVYFSNGADYIQVYTGSGMCTHLDTTDAINARYIINYANRLIQADYGSTRAPTSVKWSKEGDPSDWTDSTAGSKTFMESHDFITGLGHVGGSLVIYFRDGIAFGQRTGVSTAPIKFSRFKPGVGAIAPYGIVAARGTNVFIGRDDVYVIDGESPYPVGEKIRDKLFSVATQAELEKAFGYNHVLLNEVRWFVTDIDNIRRCFIWNYKEDEWFHYKFADTMSSGGKGGV